MEIQYAHVAEADGYVAINSDTTFGYATGVYDTIEEMINDMSIKIEMIYEDAPVEMPTCQFVEVDPSVVWN